MRISAINVRQGFNKGLKKVRQGANYVADETKQVINKMPAKARKIAFPALIGLSAFVGGMAIPNKAQAQDRRSIAAYDKGIMRKSPDKTFENWYRGECDESTFNIQSYSKDGTLASAYRELAKYTIKEVDKDNDGKMNYGEYVEHVKLEFEARKLLEEQPYPADKEQLASSNQVKNEFTCIDINNDGYIDKNEYAGLIGLRDLVMQKDFDGKISVCSLNVLGLESKNLRKYIKYIYDFITSPRESFPYEEGKNHWDNLHNPETCKERMNLIK